MAFRSWKLRQGVSRGKLVWKGAPNVRELTTEPYFESSLEIALDSKLSGVSWDRSIAYHLIKFLPRPPEYYRNDPLCRPDTESNII